MITSTSTKREKFREANKFVFQILENKSVTSTDLIKRTFTKPIEDEVQQRFFLTKIQAKTIVSKAKHEVKREKQKEEEKKQYQKTLDQIFEETEQLSGSQNFGTYGSQDVKSKTIKMGLDQSFDWNQLSTIKFQDQLIIKTIHEKKQAYLAFRESGLKKSTFYRRLRKLLKNHIILAVDKNERIVDPASRAKYSNYVINPRIFLIKNSQNSKCHFSGGVNHPKTQVPFLDHPVNSGEIKNQDQNEEIDNGTEENSSATFTKKSSFSEDHPENYETLSIVPGNSSQTENEDQKEKIESGTEENSSATFTKKSSFSKDHPENIDKWPVSPRNFASGDDSFDDKILRSHNYYYKLKILKKPIDLQFLLSISSWFEAIQLRNRTQYQHKGSLGFLHHDATIQFNNQVICIWLNDIYGRDPFENDLEANKRILLIKAFLEDEYPGLELQPSKYIRRVERKGTHHAWIHHNLALKAKQQNVSLRGRNFELDSSKETPELEAIDELNANQHISEELEDYDFRADKKYYFRNVFADIHSQKNKVADHAASLALLSNNNELFVKTIQEQEQILSEQIGKFEQISESNKSINESLAHIQIYTELSVDHLEQNAETENKVLESIVTINDHIIANNSIIEDHSFALHSIKDSLINLNTILLTPKPSLIQKLRQRIPKIVGGKY